MPAELPAWWVVARKDTSRVQMFAVCMMQIGELAPGTESRKPRISHRPGQSRVIKVCASACAWQPASHQSPCHHMVLMLGVLRS